MWIVQLTCILLLIVPDSQCVENENLETETINESTDISAVYNYIWDKIKVDLAKCIDTKKRKLFADCVYTAQAKWGPSNKDDIKTECCSFWESDACITEKIGELCSAEVNRSYLNDSRLIQSRKILIDGHCSSYQKLSDCDFPFWLVVAIIVSLVILFFICGFAILNNIMRR